MLLSDLLHTCAIKEVFGDTHLAIDVVTFDSRKVEKFALFIAVRGTQVDGHKYIDTAIENGAVAVMLEEMPEERKEKVTYILVKDARKELATIAGNMYDHPSRKLKLVGITGTNGKTTCATLLHKLFQGMGYKAGLLSTVVNKIGLKEEPSTHTTPDPIAINELLAKMVNEGCTHAFMEVSSHAIDQERVGGLDFDIAVFTNITHDHLDYHGDFNSYIGAKKKLFDDLPKQAIALVNADDRHGETMLIHTQAITKTFGQRSVADYKCKVLENGFSGLLMNINGQEVWSQLIGEFNASNLLVVFAVADLLGQDQMQTLTSLSSLTPVEGRFQYLLSDQKITGIVDYAHTPDALKNVLQTIRDIRKGPERIITLVGCGGDRDRDKRPKMAHIASKMSDQVVITSDNPRSEDPQVIIEDMKEGLESAAGVLSIVDRKEAIKTACALAMPGDIILVAGKGHEKYQEIKGEKLPFDDYSELKGALKEMQK